MKLKLTSEEYISVQMQLVAFATLVKDMKLVDFTDFVNQAETMGPILNPTLYREAGEQLNDVGRLADSLLPFQEEIRRQLRKAGV